MDIFCNEFNILGEGPIWHSQRRSLLWLDILNRTLFEKRLGGKTLLSDNSWHLPEYASALATDKHENNIIWMVTNRSFGKFDLSHGQYEPMIDLELPKNIRANDGGVAPDGHFWFGTMEWSPSGMLGKVYSISPSLVLYRQQVKIGIPNTFCWSEDGRTLYISDSFQQKMFSYKVEGGVIDNLTARVVVDLSTGDSTPDGGATDTRKGLWNVHWDGHKVVRYTHDFEPEKIIKMPVPRPTSCCFGGPDNRHLFVTSANSSLSTDELEKYPNSGCVFIRQTESTGQQVRSYCLEA